jgi:hypothetical protein
MRTTIDELTAEIRAFRDARDWLQFHNPKEPAVAISAEAGELIQHFVWQNPEQPDRRVFEGQPAIWPADARSNEEQRAVTAWHQK